MKQLSFLKSRRSISQEHGGYVTLGRRRRRRPLNIKRPLHMVLRSDFAYGSRLLTRHRPLIKRIIEKNKKRFDIRVYELAIVSNHLHILVKSRSRLGLQNFMRVIAGHIAQQILCQHPIQAQERPQTGGGAQHQESKNRETENKFWQTRVYTRIVSWGREFLIVQNTLEALGVIPYQVSSSRHYGGKQHKQLRARPKNSS